MDKLFPEVESLPQVFYARAESSGIWLSRLADGTLRSTSDFTAALPCPDKKSALKLWAQLCASTLKSGKEPAWAAKPPALFPGLSPDAPSSGLTMFMALCQGRFVCQKKTYTGFDWGLSPTPADAHIFMTEAEARGALRSALPAKGVTPAVAILPLRAEFGLPLSEEGHPTDALAAALGIASATRELEAEIPMPDAPAAKRRKHAGL